MAINAAALKFLEFDDNPVHFRRLLRKSTINHLISVTRTAAHRNTQYVGAYDGLPHATSRQDNPRV